jgi:hypothetical protein
MKVWILVLVMSCWGLRADTQVIKASSADQEFLITTPPSKKKKLSCNDLKEELGQKTKRLFDSSTYFSHRLGGVGCMLSKVQLESTKIPSALETVQQVLLSSSNINQSLGMMGQELASLQKTCSLIVEKLIDNQKPFKKATKAMLEQALQQITVAEQQLAGSTQRIKKAQESCKTTTHLKHMAQLLTDEGKKLKDMRSAIHNDECLKQL